jgi:hypothetical protein
MALRRDQRPVTDEDRRRVRELREQNLGRNEIARRLNRSPRTISVIAANLNPPVTFDRTATATATEARVIDAKARRAAIAEQLYEVIADDLAYLKPGQQYDLVEVSAGTAVEFSPKRLPAQDRRALVQSVSAALTAVARLEAVDGDPNLDAARSMLGTLAVGLNRLAALDDPPAEGDSGEG